MEYMIAHRGEEIYRLTFRLEGDDELCFIYAYRGKYRLFTIFAPIIGWKAEKVMTWLGERGFEYYWERDND